MRRSFVPSVVVGILFAALLAVVAEGSSRLLEHPFPGFLVWDNGSLVAFHRESWPGARKELPLNGGRIVRVAGEPFQGGRKLLELAASKPPGSLIEYQVAVGEEIRNYSIPTMQLAMGGFLATFGNYLFNAFCFAAIGIVALALRPDSRRARALAVATLGIGALFALAIDYFGAYRLVRVCQAVEAASPFAVALLALNFPSQRGSANFRRVVLGSLAVLGAAIFSAQWLYFYPDPSRARIATLVVYVMLAGLTVAMLVGLAQAAWGAERTDDRVRAGLVLAAAVSGLLVPALAIIAFFGLGRGFSSTWVTFLLPVFPAAVLFATVRHDLLRAERFARLAVAYGATAAGLALSYSALLFVIERSFLTTSARGTLAEFLLVVGIAVSFNPLYRRVQAAVDHLFYRSDLDAAKTLERLSVLLSTRPPEPEVIEIVSRGIADALQVEWAEIVLDDTVERVAAVEEPIGPEDRQLGSLRCGPKSSAAPFSGPELDFIVGAASLAATAIQSARSVGELKEVQAALVRSERLAAIGEVAGAVAHGVRNPLAGIRAAAQMAQEIDDPEQRAESLGDLIGGVDRLDDRIRRLLDFARMLEPELETVDLVNAGRDILSVLGSRAKQQGVRLEFVDAGQSVYVHADPRQLEEGLLELVSNALNATEAGGSVTLSAEKVGKNVRIEIRDTGCGIPEAVQQRVFDLFFTTREDGTGMGLATVRKMFERQNGDVKLVESSAAGTTFEITLRAAEI